MASLNSASGFISACTMALVALSAAPVAAQQTDERARWGIAGSLTPEWEFLHFLEDAMDKSIEMKGDELRIGIVRGKPLGSEWGISYVKRRVDDGSTMVQEKPKCLASATTEAVCAGGTSYETRGAFLNGVQMHRFFPLGTIARRVQLGAVISGGVARLGGRADQTHEHVQVTVTPSTGAPVMSIGRETGSVDAREIFSHTFVAEYMPIGGLEAAVAVIVAPGLKLRLSGGASFPGFHRVSLTAVYFFGTEN
jgi:hypothetical protein